VHGGQSAYFVQVLGLGRIQPGIELGGHDNGPFFAKRLN